MVNKLLTVAQLAEHIESDLPPGALQRELDAADALIVQRHGPHYEAGITVSETVEGRMPRITLGRMMNATEPIVIVETRGTTETTIAANDFRVLYGGRMLQRLSTGTNGSMFWGDLVKVTYTPFNDNPVRAKCLVDLVKLSLSYTGNQSERVGDVSASHQGSYDRERERILRMVSSGRMVLA